MHTDPNVMPVATPLGKPLRKTREDAPIEVPSEPATVPTPAQPVRTPEKVPG